MAETSVRVEEGFVGEGAGGARVAVVRMTAGENRFSPDFLDALEPALAGALEASAVVLTADGKYWSNGLDLDWLLGDGVPVAAAFLDRVHRLLGTVLGAPVPVVAALNGHVYAAGAMLAAACDARVMRADRGYWCLPEAALGLPFSDPMAALLRAKLPATAQLEAMVYGQRYGGEEALARGLVDEAVGEDEVLDRAVARAARLAGGSRDVVAATKRQLYAEALAALA